MMRDLILRVRLTDEEAARYEGANAMVVPLTNPEAAELQLSIVGLHEFLDQVVASLPSNGEDPFVVLAREAAERMARVRELIGRAAFVGTAEVAPGKVVMQ